MSVSSDESAAIISRMHELRSTALSDVNRLHAQVERVTDWREHVRAHPVAAITAASALGFFLVRKLTSSDSAPPRFANASMGSLPLEVTKKNRSLLRGLLSVAGGMAAPVARQWLTEYIKKQVGVHTHAANQPANAEQRSHSSH